MTTDRVASSFRLLIECNVGVVCRFHCYHNRILMMMLLLLLVCTKENDVESCNVCICSDLSMYNKLLCGQSIVFSSKYEIRLIFVPGKSIHEYSHGACSLESSPIISLDPSWIHC